MSYPQYPGGYQPYPQGQGMEPSGGTAMAAGVLASLGAVGQIFGGVLDVVVGVALPDFGDSAVAFHSWFTGYLIVLGVVGLVTGGLLTAGAVAMFRRKPLGRILIVAGCVVTIVTGVAAYTVLNVGDVSAGHGAVGLMSGFGGVVGQVFPVTTAILALVPATGRWLAHVPGRATGYPAPYPGRVPAGYPAPNAPYVDPFRPGPAPCSGRSYPGQPAPYAGQTGPDTSAGAPGPIAGGTPQAPGSMPYSNEPTPFPEVPPLDAAEDSWRRPGN